MRVEDISFSYGTKKVLDKVSFEADGNSVVSILGPNGTGKTTLLKCICNVHSPESGNITVNDNNVKELHGKKLARTIGYVPQSVPVSRMTVFDSVFMGRRPRIEWMATPEDLEKTSEVLDRLGLGHLSLSYVDEISGGEYQKVQIARALLQEPDVLILDEPTNNLDISNQHITMHMIADAVRERGMCTIMTMHDINLAVHFSDKFLFMKNGKVAAYGGPEVITAELVKEVYGMDVDVIDHRGVPFVVPLHSSRYEHIHSHTHPHDVHDHLTNGTIDHEHPDVF